MVEGARAKPKLMKLKQFGSIDSFIATFRDLVELCETRRSQAYLFFFNGLPNKYKEEFTKACSTCEPTNMLEVFERTRTFEMAPQWADGTKKTSCMDKTTSP